MPGLGRIGMFPLRLGDKPAGGCESGEGPGSCCPCLPDTVPDGFQLGLPGFNVLPGTGDCEDVPAGNYLCDIWAPELFTGRTCTWISGFVYECTIPGQFGGPDVVLRFFPFVSMFTRQFPFQPECAIQAGWFRPQVAPAPWVMMDLTLTEVVDCRDFSASQEFTGGFSPGPNNGTVTVDAL